MDARQYTFAWQFRPDSDMAPRGGTTSGSAVDLVTAPGDAWQALQEPGISTKEKDRRAILAMAGPYRASFDFIETAGFTPDYSPPPPYQSWGTERVYVVADETDYISLQHILVMFINMPDGTTSDPIVVKHWRQDWQYEQKRHFAFVGDNRWELRKVPRADVRGSWVQSVYQVDDSPRYAAHGRWQHTENYSSWESAETWRPLPRREFSVRDDYQVLIGSNRHTITPTGWIHVENNNKVVLTADDGQLQPAKVLAVEAGLNRYERIDNHDWSAGDQYWDNTGLFWAEVRKQWDSLLSSSDGTALNMGTGKDALFMKMFALADTFAGEKYNADAAAGEIADTLNAHLIN
ncbi:MAG: DUF6607 family protein [Pseudomonadota bacterium]